VLLVEDDPDAAALTRAQMSEDKNVEFRVEWKPNILNAISRLAKPGIDVVLLDLGMPNLSGYKTHMAITRVTKKTPVVIFTSDESAVSRSMTKAQGAFTYLVKRRTSPIELRHALNEAALSAPL
jgi:DNA-binding response OmpR family regulator